jgi:glutaconate CoA-transferase subunit A
MTAAQAIGSLQDGMTVAIGGSMFHNKPMHLVREIVRRRLRNLTVIAVPQGSIDVDCLIGAGCVGEVRAPYVGFEYLGLAPNFRRHCADGTIRVWECDETQLIAGLEAAAKNLPSAMTKTGVGTDLPTLNSDLKLCSDPITGEPMIAVPAIAPDVTLLHAASADIHGNARYRGYGFGDLLLAEATKRSGGRVVVSVDEIVPPEQSHAAPFGTDLPYVFIDSVVEAPYGAHPCSSHGNYNYDEAHLREYIALCRNGQEGVATYLERYVDVTSDQANYLRATVRVDRLVELRKEIYV